MAFAFACPQGCPAKTICAKLNNDSQSSLDGDICASLAATSSSKFVCMLASLAIALLASHPRGRLRHKLLRFKTEGLQLAEVPMRSC